MLFNSFEFLLFFPVVTFLYFCLPDAYRWVLLLVASAIFYMAFVPEYILILVFLILVDYIAGIAIENAEGRKRDVYLLASIVANVGVLAFFKYFHFINTYYPSVFAPFAYAFHLDYPIKNVLLPVGLSFHTFQSMSYTIEVHRKNYRAERHLGIYALYVLFYPQLVAGPIERPQNLIPQLKKTRGFDYDRVVDGLKLMLGGFLKKVLVADRLGVLVDQVYNSPQGYSGWPLIAATYLFGFQIYCDFSGYTDIARGFARVMSFELMENFKRPYFATSISEYWSR